MPETYVRKILILRFSSLGDIVMATPMIRVLRKAFPLAQIDMIVRSDFLALIQSNPHLDRALTLDRNEGILALWKLRKQINREHYDLIYDAHRSLRTFLLMPFLKAERKVYFSKPYLKRALALTFKIKSLIRGSKRMLERYIEPLAPLGVKYDEKGPELFSQDSPSIHPLLEQLGLEPHRKYIGIIPSAQWPGKRWPLKYFKDLMGLLVKNTSEKLVVLGGPQDDFCKDLVSGLAPERVLNLQGKLSLLSTIEVFKFFKLCIANDTGLMHMADALQIPSVLIFGPTNADMGCLPFHPQSRVIEQNLWCRPCSKNGEAPCIRLKRWCLELTTPKQVFEATNDLLSQLEATRP